MPNENAGIEFAWKPLPSNALLNLYEKISRPKAGKNTIVLKIFFQNDNKGKQNADMKNKPGGISNYQKATLELLRIPRSR
jgi:hypothetical protein